MAKKIRHEEHEEHADETWLVPYADVLTLLLALFIVLFAMSKVDENKFKQMAESFREAFSAGNPSVGILPSNATIDPIVAPPPPPPPAETSAKRKSGVDEETNQLTSLKRQLDNYIATNNLKSQLETELTNDGLVLVIKDTLFFPSGSANMIPQSEHIATSIATMLTTIDQKVVVSGHTDNMRINTPEFPSNWDLSSKRAVNFMKYILQKEPTLQPERFSAIGYGEYKPVAVNTTEEGRQQNRRVEILIVRNYRLPEE